MVKKKKQNMIPAGVFSEWLRRIRKTFRTEEGIEVDCGACTACCSSSYFIRIWPDESEALARINKKLLVPAPGLPKGQVLMGYDKQGRCPMLKDGKCSIFEYRPRTCRKYDCRIFPAAGLTKSDNNCPKIDKQLRLWKFDYPTKRDKDEHKAVIAAAKFIKNHPEIFPAGKVPNTSGQLAILALKVYKVFLSKKKFPPPETAKAIVKELEK